MNLIFDSPMLTTKEYKGMHYKIGHYIKLENVSNTMEY